MRDEAIADFGHQIVGRELVTIEDGERFARQVDHDGVLGDAGDASEHFFANVKRGAFSLRSVLGARGTGLAGVLAVGSLRAFAALAPALALVAVALRVRLARFGASRGCSLGSAAFGALGTFGRGTLLTLGALRPRGCAGSGAMTFFPATPAAPLFLVARTACWTAALCACRRASLVGAVGT